MHALRKGLSFYLFWRKGAIFPSLGVAVQAKIECGIAQVRGPVALQFVCGCLVMNRDFYSLLEAVKHRDSQR